MNALWLAALLLLGGFGCSEPAFKHGPDVSILTGPPNRMGLIHAEHLPNVELTTHEGRVVRFYEDLVKGQVVAINFMFTTCGNTCPLITEYLAAAQKALGEPMSRKISLLSISLEPEHDTPEVLRGYRQVHGVSQGWIFLTGRRDDIEFLRRRLGVYDLDPAIDTDPSQHAGIVILGNEPQGRWRAISALSHPIRIRQAMERIILPSSQWATGETVVNEVPAQDNEEVETADLSVLP
jgi:protein SCO1/2